MVGDPILVEVVRSNLLVPVRLSNLTLPRLADLLEGFADVPIGENLFQSSNRNFTVFDLRAILLALDLYAGRDVSQPNRAFCFVHVLAAGTAGGLSLELYVLFWRRKMSEIFVLRLTNSPFMSMEASPVIGMHAIETVDVWSRPRASVSGTL